MGKSNFHDQKNARIQRYKDLSDKAAHDSQLAYKASNDAVAGIPPGQPILVGHHSERAHRNAIKKSWDKLGKSVELTNKSQYYADKAIAAATNTAISSDDPDALDKLNAKLNALVAKQEFMKSVNRICRSKKMTETQIKEKLMTDYQLSDNEVQNLLHPKYSYEKKGFQHYQLTNNNAKIKQTRRRISQVSALQNLENKNYTFGAVKITVNADDNRVEIYFPEKPDNAFRKKLSSNGFRWSRYKSAWQMKISRWNIKQAMALVEEYNNE